MFVYFVVFSNKRPCQLNLMQVSMVSGNTERHAEGSSTNIFPWRSERLGKDGADDQGERSSGDRNQTDDQ